MSQPEKISLNPYDGLYLAICMQMPFSLPALPENDAYGKTVEWETSQKFTPSETMRYIFALFDVDTVQPPFFDPDGLHIASCTITTIRPGYEKSERYMLMKDGAVRYGLHITEGQFVTETGISHKLPDEHVEAVIDTLSHVADAV